MSKRIWTYIIGLLLIIGGGFLLLNPEQSFNKLVFFVGAVLIGTGLFKIIFSIVNRDSLFLPGNTLFGGFFNVGFGLILAFNPNTTVKIITVFVGLWLIVSSVFSLAMILNIRINKDIYQKSLVSNILKLILGIIVFTTPIVSILFTGAFIGLILIAIGIYTIINFKDKEKIYKVKVKK